MAITPAQKELADFVPQTLLKILKEGRNKATSDGQVVNVDATEADMKNAIEYLKAYDITKMPGVGDDDVAKLALHVSNYPFPKALPDMDGKDAATA